MPLPLDDTIAAIATAPGEGAIGVVRLSGPGAVAIARRLFHPAGRRANGAAWRPRHLYHGQVRDPATGAAVDDVLLTFFRAPHSYTGQDVVELSGHGGSVGLRELVRLAVVAGARPAERGEFTLRAFLAGKLDLAQAEAVADAVRAQTPAALSLAVQQLDGALSQRVGAIRQAVMGVAAHLEATIDFTEDDVPPLPAEALRAPLRQAASALHRLLATARSGMLYREGVRIALVGRPNAGKSSLLNALLGADRAIVTPIAGTTRDVIEERIDLEGVPAVLADTAGLTETLDPVERLGVERSRAALDAADVLALVVDRSAPLHPDDVALWRTATEAGRPLVVCLTKADLPAHLSRQEVIGAFTGLPEARVVEVSAVTGAGLGALRQAFSHVIGAHGGALGARHEQAVVTNARHREALERAHSCLVEAIAAVERELPADFVGIDLRAALEALGEVTGESVTEELLTTIFSRFCIGK